MLVMLPFSFPVFGHANGTVELKGRPYFNAQHGLDMRTTSTYIAYQVALWLFHDRTRTRRRLEVWRAAKVLPVHDLVPSRLHPYLRFTALSHRRFPRSLLLVAGPGGQTAASSQCRWNCDCRHSRDWGGSAVSRRGGLLQHDQARPSLSTAKRSERQEPSPAKRRARKRELQTLANSIDVVVKGSQPLLDFVLIRPLSLSLSLSPQEHRRSPRRRAAFTALPCSGSGARAVFKDLTR